MNAKPPQNGRQTHRVAAARSAAAPCFVDEDVLGGLHSFSKICSRMLRVNDLHQKRYLHACQLPSRRCLRVPRKCMSDAEEAQFCSCGVAKQNCFAEKQPPSPARPNGGTLHFDTFFSFLCKYLTKESSNMNAKPPKRLHQQHTGPRPRPKICSRVV